MYSVVESASWSGVSAKQNSLKLSSPTLWQKKWKLFLWLFLFCVIFLTLYRHSRRHKRSRWMNPNLSRHKQSQTPRCNNRTCTGHKIWRHLKREIVAIISWGFITLVKALLSWRNLISPVVIWHPLLSQFWVTPSPPLPLNYDRECLENVNCNDNFQEKRGPDKHSLQEWPGVQWAKHENGNLNHSVMLIETTSK